MASKRLILGVATTLFLASATAFAQSRMEELAQTTPEERAQLQTAMMKDKLGLSAEQLSAVSKINLAIATQMQPVIGGSDGPLIKMRKAKAIGAQRDAELQKVLQPQQYQQWIAEKEAIKQQAEAKLMETQGGTN